MKKLLVVLILIMTASVIGFSTNKPASASDMKDKLVRFHVIANSDSEEDQAVKLKVRDAVLKKLGSPLEKLDSQEESLVYLESKLADIEKTANDILKKEGKTYRAKAMIGDYEFPVKNYNTITLPEGEYKALRVVLGEGDGKNWWCVMFPPLCFIDITRGYTEEKTDAELKKVLTDDQVQSITAFKGRAVNKSSKAVNKNSQNSEKTAKDGVKEEVKGISSETSVEFRFKSVDFLKSTFDKLKSLME